MGIPSFYRQLCRQFPHIISRDISVASQWLCLDFNCAMYHVLRLMPAFPAFPALGDAGSTKKWETAFCDAIVAYLEEIIVVAKPTEGIYVSCDGVVCAAKRRQQRLRRFKGPWVAAAEPTAKVATESWDQNALTPGSAFMAQLGVALTVAGKRIAHKTGLTVVVSTTSEPGEGEHKLLTHMRSLDGLGTCTIYGLDADLILLSMLLMVDGVHVRLLREAQEFERHGAPAGWRTVDIHALSQAIGVTGSDNIRDFVAAMSLLGNDFLPKSLTYTVRNDGIPLIVSILRTTGRLVVDGAIQRGALIRLVEALAAGEEVAMTAACVEAIKVRSRHTGGATPDEQALNEWNAQPAKWATILQLYNSNKRALRPDWRQIYRARFAEDSSPAAYCEGIAWVWDYYSGRAVDLGWSFDAHLPPLWSDILDTLRVGAGSVVRPPPLTYTTYLPDWLHLLSVLPADSAKRLLPAKRLALLTQKPWYWPTQFAFFDVGRTQMWECEVVIPIFPEAVLRSVTAL